MAVRPVIIKYEHDLLNLAYDVIPFMPLYILQTSTFGFKCSLKELPPFVPNDHLFKKFGGNNKEKWEVYANAVRDIMAKEGNIKTSDV